MSGVINQRHLAGTCRCHNWRRPEVSQSRFRYLHPRNPLVSTLYSRKLQMEHPNTSQASEPTKSCLQMQLVISSSPEENVHIIITSQPKAKQIMNRRNLPDPVGPSNNILLFSRVISFNWETSPANILDPALEGLAEDFLLLALLPVGLDGAELGMKFNWSRPPLALWNPLLLMKSENKVSTFSRPLHERSTNIGQRWILCF